MKLLGIESSCDETAAAVVEDGRQILSNVVHSQIDLHAAYGGVIPEVAARSHLEVVLPVIHQALSDAHCAFSDLDGIAVTHTPGLVGSLLIGTLTARTLALLYHLPLYPTHHLKSHIFANWLSHNEPALPLLALVISGGHTQIIYLPDFQHFKIIGTTRDDAIGEVFDKAAKILGLPYPGGPAISKLAAQADAHRYHLPIPQVPELDFSFSGLKTAFLRAVQKELNLPISTPSYQLATKLSPTQIADFAASFEFTATDILLRKLKRALSLYPDVKSLVFAGGVSANTRLREMAQQTFASACPVYFPAPSLSTDNGAMVASAAYFAIKAGEKPSDPLKLDISPRCPIY